MRSTTAVPERHVAACCACDWRYRDGNREAVSEAAVAHRDDDCHPVIVRTMATAA